MTEGNQEILISANGNYFSKSGPNAAKVQQTDGGDRELKMFVKEKDSLQPTFAEERVII